MSRWDYLASKGIAVEGHPFDALIMAAMRRADGPNLLRLQGAFPDVWDELETRYNARGGLLDSDCRCQEEWDPTCPLHGVGGPRHADTAAEPTERERLFRKGLDRVLTDHAEALADPRMDDDYQAPAPPVEQPPTQEERNG